MTSDGYWTVRSHRSETADEPHSIHHIHPAPCQRRPYTAAQPCSTRQAGANADRTKAEARCSTSLSTDVTLKLLDDEILLGDDVFHQVPDRDETDQLAVIQDGKMTQPFFRHQRHTFLGALLWTHTQNWPCHDVAYQRLLRRFPHEHDLARIVALGQHADDCL